MLLHVSDLAQALVIRRKHIHELARHALVRFFNLP